MKKILLSLFSVFWILQLAGVPLLRKISIGQLKDPKFGYSVIKITKDQLKAPFRAGFYR